MTDIVNSKTRSIMMSGIRSGNTKPEKLVRSLLHRKGFRFRLHRKDLPGKPDIVLSRYRTVIFVHGCFWHRHKDCKLAYTPKTRTEFWARKFMDNISRDAQAQQQLTDNGWHVVVVWECETRNREAIQDKLNQIIKDLRNRQ